MTKGIHDAIREARQAKGMTMVQLAARISEIEGLAKPIRWQNVQQWEKPKGQGGTAPRRERLEAVAQALGIHVRSLLGPPPLLHVVNASSPKMFADLDGLEGSLITMFRSLSAEDKGLVLTGVNDLLNKAMGRAPKQSEERSLLRLIPAPEDEPEESS